MNPTDAEPREKETPFRTKFLDYDARRKPKTDHSCVKCQRDLKPGQPFRIVHVFEGAFVVHPDGPQPDDVSAYPVGMDCAKAIGMEWTREPDATLRARKETKHE